jgi:hypothetical protein
VQLVLDALRVLAEVCALLQRTLEQLILEILLYPLCARRQISASFHDDQAVSQ